MVTVCRRLAAVLLFGLVCCTAISQGVSPHDVTPNEIPIDDFIRQPDFSKVTISPNGQYIAAIVSDSQNPYENLLAILDGQSGKLLNVIHSGHSALVENYFWAGDNRLVASLAMRRRGLDRPALTGELFAINADGSNQINLFGPRAADRQLRLETQHEQAAPILDYPVSSDEILVSVKSFTNDPAGSFPQARYINVQNGEEASMATFPVPDAKLFADHAGHVRAASAWYENSREALWLHEGHAGNPHNSRRTFNPFMPFQAHGFNSGKGILQNDIGSNAGWHLINDPFISKVIVEPIGFNHDNTKLYVRITRGRLPESIGLYDLSNHQTTILFRGQFANPGQMLATANGQDYYAVISEDGIRSLAYFDENSPEAQINKAVSVHFPGQLAYLSSFTRDGKRAIVTVVSDRNPGDYYLLDLQTNKLRLIIRAMPWIQVDRMRGMQPISLNARDGLTLHGFLTLPAGNKPYPLIVLPHGGPIAYSDTWGFNAEAQMFASRGYAVLQVNFRGSGGRGAWFESLGYRQWGLSMQDDLTDATHWAIAQGYADPNRICIYGASYGGYAALEGAVKEPDLYKCAIGYDGVYDLRVQLDDSDTRKTNAGMSYLQAALGTDRDDLLRRSPLSGADRIKADVLLLHGKEDERTPYKNFKEFTKALDRNDKHYETLVDSDEGHGFFLPKHQQAAYQKMLDFLDRNIGTNTNTSH